MAVVEESRKNDEGPEGAARYLGVLRYGARALHLVWTTSHTLTLSIAFFTLIAGTVPAAAAYIGKLVVDGVVLAANSGATADREVVLFWVVVEGLMIMTVAGSQRGLITCQYLLRAVMGHRITTMILEKALTLRLDDFENPELHDRMMQARREAVSRPVQLVTGTFTLIRDTVSLISYGVLLLQFSGWAVAIIVLAGLPAFLVEARFSGEAFRFLKSKTPEMRERNYLETVVTREDFAKELLIFRLGRKLIERYHALFHKTYSRDRKLQLKRGVWGFILGTFSSAALYGAYIWIVLEAIAGRLTIGEMTMYLVLFRQGQAAVTSSLTSIGVMYENNLYLSTLYLFLEYPVPKHSGREVTAVDTDDGLRLEDVTYTYPGSNRPAVDHVSFHLKPGQQLALVGENGSGKTTLVKLLTRLYEPDEGQIVLHGRDIQQWHVQDLRRRLAAIFQDFVRFKLTVGENIGAGDVDHLDDKERWVEAAKQALALPMIESLPEGFDTRLGRSFAGGFELSGGQWQKVALARLFMRKDADIFILDEPTASVDAEAEAEIFSHVREVTEGRMSILISHRLSMPRSADLILVMAGGRIIERGKHSELMALDGRYAELFRLQASGYRDSFAGDCSESSDDD